jgi:hypothetical protein
MTCLTEVSKSHGVGRWPGMVRVGAGPARCVPIGACRSLWRPHDSDRLTQPGTGNATRHRTGRRRRAMSSSTVPSTSPALKTRRRRPAGEVVLGVDTHRDNHVAAALSLSGAVLGTEEFPVTTAGYRDLLKSATKSGTVRRAGVEGTGSYGASLSRYLLAQGVDVFDVNRMDQAECRRRGKTDPLDAQNAARAVLSAAGQRGVLRRFVRCEPRRAFLGTPAVPSPHRCGDRQANAALHRIVFTRLRVDPRTQDYYDAGSRRARPGAKSSVASNATRPGRSSTWSNSYSQDPANRGCRDR